MKSFIYLFNAWDSVWMCQSDLLNLYNESVRKLSFVSRWILMCLNTEGLESCHWDLLPNERAFESSTLNNMWKQTEMIIYTVLSHAVSVFHNSPQSKTNTWMLPPTQKYLRCSSDDYFLWHIFHWAVFQYEAPTLLLVREWEMSLCSSDCFCWIPV